MTTSSGERKVSLVRDGVRVPVDHPGPSDAACPWDSLSLRRSAGENNNSRR